jgi:hypothetical protein
MLWVKIGNMRHQHIMFVSLRGSILATTRWQAPGNTSKRLLRGVAQPGNPLPYLAPILLPALARARYTNPAISGTILRMYATTH